MKPFKTLLASLASVSATLLDAGFRQICVCSLSFAALTTFAFPADYNGIQSASFGRRLYVDCSKGDDNNDGLSDDHPLRTIQAAADHVEAGDVVYIRPGIYNERVVLSRRFGTETSPIIFQADAVEKGRVVLTSADAEIRTAQSRWVLVDGKTGLYAIPYSGEKPSRVLYDNVDLYPYDGVSNLNAFMTGWEGGSPGPQHGWCYDAKKGKLYVRLHSSGQYGSANPNEHVMAVAPRKGYGFVIRGDGPAYIQLKGITFETPGNAAIFTAASAVTVQDCWFFGSPYGVRGNSAGDTLNAEADPDKIASDIIIERCEFTEISTLNDVHELLRSRKEKGEPATWSDIWHRKATGRRGMPDDVKGYETGIAAQIGRNWIIRYNYIHDIFEGLANDSMNFSADTKIYGNVFSRLCDNGVEVENHARNAIIYQNIFLDVFEPFSCQPLAGTPWPGPVEFYENIIANTPGEITDLWQNGPSEARAAFKIGISLRNWEQSHMSKVPQSPLAMPEPGLRFFNNTVFFPGGRLINVIGDPEVPVSNVIFENNIFVSSFLYTRLLEDDLREGHFTFIHNLVFMLDIPEPTPAKIAAGRDELCVTNLGAVGLAAPYSGDFSLSSSSPALNAHSGSTYSNLGAIQPNRDWFPLSVGPNAAVKDFKEY